MWIRYCKLQEEMCLSAYYLLLELIGYDLRYQPERNKFFFIAHDDAFNTTEDFLAEMVGIKINTLEKKLFPILNDFVNFRKTGDVLRIQIKWDVLLEVYKKNAHRIPFEDGGLKNIPSDFTGWVKPTPFHGICIENGIIKKYERIDEKKDTVDTKEIVNNNPKSIISEKKFQKESEHKENMENKISVSLKPTEKPVLKASNQIQASQSNVSLKPVVKPINTSSIAQKLRELKMAEPQINYCMEREDVTMNVIKHLNEMLPDEKESKKNIPGFIYALVRDGFKPPKGFETCKAVEERRNRKEAEEEFAENITEKFNSGEIKYFTPPDGKKYKITSIPNNTQFLYNKNGLPVCQRFCDVMDERFFSG